MRPFDRTYEGLKRIFLIFIGYRIATFDRTYEGLKPGVTPGEVAVAGHLLTVPMRV